ncbi:MAG: uridine kinase [Acidobacteria bacterium]|nr:uridine kinase [Acidobacteriota bacterium]
MDLPLIIGVAGGTGSGKTTVARAIIERVGTDRVLEITQDRYYADLKHLPLTARNHRNYDHPDSVEGSLLVHHLRRLKQGLPADLPIYDFTCHERRPESEAVTAKPVILVEGILIFALVEVRELLDIKIFVDTDSDVRFIRRLTRDMGERGRTLESVVDQYLETVRPMHLEFVEPSKRWADVIIPEGGFNTVALDFLISRIEAKANGMG